jgi:DNA-directed RNA polymerase subunit K/omega
MNEYFDLYTTQPRITKYEYARLIGIRAKQIAKGSPINVERYSYNKQIITCPLVIAEKEMHAREMPLTVQRKSETINPNQAKLPF